MVPLYRLASIVPWKKRTTAICLYEVHAAEHMVTPDQRIRVKGSQMLGLIFCRINACGMSATTLLVRWSAKPCNKSDLDWRAYPAVNNDIRILN